MAGLDDLIARAILTGSLCNARGALATRYLDDGRVLDVVPLLPGTVRLCISRDADTLVYQDVF